MTLSKLSRRQQAKILHLPQDLALRAKLIEQGIVPNTLITLAHKAPFNGPLAFHFDGIKVSLQRSVAEQIQVEVIE